MMKKILNDAPVSSALIAIFGLVLLLMPSLTNKIVVYGIGIVLLVYGAGRIFRYVQRDAAAGMSDHDLSIGLICAVCGLFMLLHSSVIISILPFLFGLFLIFGAARSIQTAFDVRRFHGLHWSFHLFIGFCFGIAGIKAIRNPFGTAKMLTRFVGGCMLILGIYLFFANRKVSQLRSGYMPEADIIDQQDDRQRSDL